MDQIVGWFRGLMLPFIKLCVLFGAEMNIFELEPNINLIYGEEYIVLHSHYILII